MTTAEDAPEQGTPDHQPDHQELNDTGMVPVVKTIPLRSGAVMIVREFNEYSSITLEGGAGEDDDWSMLAGYILPVTGSSGFLVTEGWDVKSLSSDTLRVIADLVDQHSLVWTQSESGKAVRR